MEPETGAVYGIAMPHESSTRPAPSGQAAWRLTLVVAASGCAGLGYEIVWTRMLSLALGSDMMAVLGVVAGFFAGLALGAFALDRPLRRARAPARAYALLEAAIGIWGVVSVALLPAAARAVPYLLGTAPPQWQLWAAGFLVPAIALLPATFAMGGTLAALERMLAAARRDARLTALVYGANTAGAVAGTLAAIFIFFPALGFAGTLLALAGVNALCAVGALAWGPARAEPEHAVSGPGLPARLALRLLLTGLLGVAFEVVIVRLAAQALQDTIYSFAGLLAAYLLGTACGGLLWQAAARSARRPGLAPLLAATMLACLLTALTAPAIAPIATSAAAHGIRGEFALALALFLLPAAAMGAVFSDLAQAVRDQRGSLGFAVGVNSIGAALAPLLAAQILIPGLGVWRALLALALLYLPLMPWRVASLAWAAAPAALGLFLAIRPAPLLIRVPAGGALIAVREGPMVTASAVDDASGARYLEVNGHFRMGGTTSQRSDYRQAIVPLLLHPSPRDALFLGVGTGATLVGGSRMPGVTAQGVELSAEVAALLPTFADPAAGLPIPHVTVADARRFVLADREPRDVIIADLYHPALDGSGALYTVEHFSAVRALLAPHGVFCQWLPLYQLDAPSLRTIIRSFLAVYPGATAWLNHYSVGTPMLALIGGTDALRLDPAALAARLADPPTARLLGPLGLVTPLDLLGQFVGGPRALAAYAGAGALNTDDFPAVSLDAARNVRALTAPPASLLLSLIAAVHPDPRDILATGADASWGPRLGAYWKARDRFLQAGAALSGSPRGLSLIAAAAPGLIETVRASAEFEPAYQPLLSMARALAGSDRAAALTLLRQIDAAAPSRPEARALIAQMTE